MGLVAKEEVVGVFGVLYGVTDEEGEDTAAHGHRRGRGDDATTKKAALSPIAQRLSMNPAAAMASWRHSRSCIFNLLCAPCFAAMGAIKREMNNAQVDLASPSAISACSPTAYRLIVYQLGLLFSGAGFTLWTAVAILLVVFFVYMLVRKNRYDDEHFTQKVKVGA